MLVGSQIGHALAYRLVYPVASLRVHELLITGHGYLYWGPRLLGVVFAFELVAIGHMVVDEVRRDGRAPRPVPAWAFVLLPVIGFTIQEFFERLFLTRTFPWWMVEQPTFRVGVLLQLPVGLLCYAVARLLLRAARAVAETLTWRPRLAPVPPVTAPVWAASTGDVPRLGIRGRGWGSRGPPPARLI